MNDLGDRIKYLRQTLKLTQEEFVKNIGISRGRLSEIEKGDKPKDSVLVAISKVFNINLNWLKTGQGKMIESNQSDRLISDLDIYSKEILKMLLNMSENEKKYFHELIKKQKKVFDSQKEVEEFISKGVG